MCLHVDIFMRRKDFKSYYGLHNEQNKNQKKKHNEIEIKLQMNEWLNEWMNNFYRASPNNNRTDCETQQKKITKIHRENQKRN